MQTVDPIEDDISDEALEAAGMETAGAWTFICTSGIQCRQVPGDDGHLLCGARQLLAALREHQAKPDWMKDLAATSPGSDDSGFVTGQTISVDGGALVRQAVEA